MVYRMTDEE